MTTGEHARPRLPWPAADPYSYYRERRLEGPVVWDETASAWLILGYRSARQILGTPGWTSNPLANPTAPDVIRSLSPDILRRNLLTSDELDHHRLRSAVRDVFTPRSIARLRNGIETIATDVIDRIPAGSTFDFMTEIAHAYPLAVTAAWLDLDLDFALLLRQESPAISRMLGDFSDPENIENGTASFATLLAAMLPLGAERRRTPGDDLISCIAANTDLELDDVVTTALIIAVAGHEPTANLLGSSAVRLLSTPIDNADKPPALTEVNVDDRLASELLRLDSPVQAVMRTATTN